MAAQAGARASFRVSIPMCPVAICKAARLGGPYAAISQTRFSLRRWTIGPLPVSLYHRWTPWNPIKTEKERLQRQFCEIGARVMCHVSGIVSLGGSFGGRLGRVGGRGRAGAWDTFGCFCALLVLVHGSFVTFRGGPLGGSFGGRLGRVVGGAAPVHGIHLDVFVYTIICTYVFVFKFL